MIELANDQIYVTYLHKKNVFDKEKIVIYFGIPSMINKPDNAWWGSPIDASWGWKNWCLCEDFGNYDFDNPIKWKLTKDSKILRIGKEEVFSSKSILKKYTVNPYSFFNNDLEILPELFREEVCLDFQKILDDGITAVELLDGSIGHSLDSFRIPLAMMFNSWDCESIVVLDKSKIIFLGGE